MKRIFSTIIATLITSLVFSQTENYKIAIRDFQRNYNSNYYSDIFDRFSADMQKALPLEKTNAFLKGLKNQVGNIESMEFVGYQQKTFASYKTKFEKSVLAVNISLDDQNQVNGFSVKPFENQPLQANKTVNALDSYPKEIAETIFSKCKDLPNKAQLSIAITQLGKTNYYGVIKLNDSIKPVQNEKDFFEIGSITKVFTSTVLAGLVESKKIKLTDEINSYYPFAFKDNIRLTFETLANHTSGLPRLPENLDLSDSVNPYKGYGKIEIETYLKNVVKLENNPATIYSYSNIGAGLLGYTLGLSQKTNFQNLLQKKVFAKYNMTHSVTSSKNLGNRLIKGLNNNGEVVANWDFDVLFGAGGIISTTEDLAKFANAQFNPNNKELAITRATTFVIKGDTKIGLGWHILESKNSDELFWHNGGTGGYSSSIAMKIKDRKAVVILSNVFNVNNKIDALSYELINPETSK